jgi:hypothetical protein
MRLEIIVDNEEPKIISLNKPKVIIGSQETCEIVLQHSDVSRKHLTISFENDAYFVTDQGSTNGSYINEERLVPGRKFEFTSFFPVRLGTNVLVTLLTDEDANDLGFNESANHDSGSASGDVENRNDDATRTISLKELQAARTHKLVKKREETIVKRRTMAKARPEKKPKSSDSTRMFWVGVICMTMVGSAFYYINYVKVPIVTDLKPIVDKTHVNKKTVKVVPKIAVVDIADIVPKTKFATILQGQSCTSDLEKYLCEKFPANSPKVIQVGTMMILFLNGGDYYQQAKGLLPQSPEQDNEMVNAEKKARFIDDLYFTALILFLRDKTPADFDYEKLKGVNLTFSIYFDHGNETGAYGNLVIIPDSLKKLTKVMEPKHFELAQKYGADSLYFLKEYFRQY